jgi:hypothetical protein
MPAPGTVEFSVERQQPYTRWLPFVKWLLLGPHWAALALVAVGVFLCWLVAVPCILVTGRYPRGLYDFVLGGGRWLVRVNVYASLLTDVYPPFALYDVESYPVRVVAAPPPDYRVERWRPLLAPIMMLPQYLLILILYLGFAVLASIAFWTIVIDARVPQAVFDLMSKIIGFNVRVNTYAVALTTRYPGFTL